MPNRCTACELLAALWAGLFSAPRAPSARASASTVGAPSGTSSVLLSRVTHRNVSDLCEHLLRASCHLLPPVAVDLMERCASGSPGCSFRSGPDRPKSCFLYVRGGLDRKDLGTTRRAV